jgi:hypothetical protein
LLNKYEKSSVILKNTRVIVDSRAVYKRSFVRMSKKLN